MANELLGMNTSQKLQDDVIRSQITTMVNFIKKDFKSIPEEFKKYNLRVANDLRTRWDKDKERRKYEKSEEKTIKIVESWKLMKDKDSEKRMQKWKLMADEIAVKRLERWREMKKEFRLIALNKLTATWYDRIWKLRSDLSLITAIYEYSEIEEIFHSDADIKPQLDLKPVVLRMRAPKKPTKKSFKVIDLKFDIGDAYLEMIKPLEDWTVETKTMVDKLSGVRAKQTLKTKIKRYKDTLMAREYMSVYAQSLVPRTEGIVLNGTE